MQPDHSSSSSCRTSPSSTTSTRHSGTIGIVSGSFDCHARVHDPETGEVVRSFSFPNMVTQSVQFSESEVLSATTGCHLQFWDYKTGTKRPSRLSCKSGELYNVQLLAHNSVVASGGWSGGNVVNIWKLVSSDVGESPHPHKQDLELPGHTSDIFDLAAWSERPEWVISGSCDSTTRIWDWEKAVCLKTFRLQGSILYGLAVDEVESTLFVGEQSQRVTFWDLRSFRHIGEIGQDHPNGVVSSLIVRQRKRHLVILDKLGRLCFYDLRLLSRPLNDFAVHQTGSSTDHANSFGLCDVPDLDFVVSTSYRDRCVCASMENGKLLWRIGPFNSNPWGASRFVVGDETSETEIAEISERILFALELGWSLDVVVIIGAMELRLSRSALTLSHI